MQLDNTTQYTIRILSYIAKNGTSRLYPAKELSNILEIPYKFLTKIMTELVKSGFVESIKGRVGGYKLSKPAKEISIYDILESSNKLVDDTKCILGIGKCDGEKKCALHDKWVEPRDLIKKMYKDTTLDKLEGQDFKM